MRRVSSDWLAGALVAACSSGESILNAGNDPLADDDDDEHGAERAASVDRARPDDDLDARPDDDEHATCVAASHVRWTRSPTSTEPVELTFWYGLQTEVETHLAALTEQYHAQQDKVRVTLENQVGSKETFDKYVQSSQDGRPDLVLLPEYVVQQMADGGTVIPIGACIEESGYDTSAFLAGALEAYRTGGVQWSMPFNVSTPVLFFNERTFEAAGLDITNPPVSLEQLRQASQTIVDAGAATYGIALDSGVDSGGAWFLEQWFAKAGQLYADNGNGRLARATRVLFNGPAGVELLTDGAIDDHRRAGGDGRRQPPGDRPAVQARRSGAARSDGDRLVRRPRSGDQRA